MDAIALIENESFYYHYAVLGLLLDFVLEQGIHFRGGITGQLRVYTITSNFLISLQTKFQFDFLSFPPPPVLNTSQYGP